MEVNGYFILSIHIRGISTDNISGFCPSRKANGAGEITGTEPAIPGNYCPRGIEIPANRGIIV